MLISLQKLISVSFRNEREEREKDPHSHTIHPSNYAFSKHMANKILQLTIQQSELPTHFFAWDTADWHGNPVSGYIPSIILFQSGWGVDEWEEANYKFTTTVLLVVEAWGQNHRERERGGGQVLMTFLGVNIKLDLGLSLPKHKTGSK